MSYYGFLQIKRGKYLKNCHHNNIARYPYQSYLALSTGAEVQLPGCLLPVNIWDILGRSAGQVVLPTTMARGGAGTGPGEGVGAVCKTEK